jgi:ribonuclease HI
MLIGMDSPFLNIQREMIYRTDKHHIAVRYDLGWSCFGRLADKSMALFPTLLLNKKEEHNDIKEIHELLRTTWTYDQFPTESLTQNEEHCVKTLTDSSKVIGGRAFVSPLFKPGQPQPGLNNYHYANKRLDSVNSKLTESEKVVIDGIYDKYLEQGIIRKVDIKIHKPWQGGAIYWPTIIVHQPKSETTPVRPCCDGRAKHMIGKSINEMLFLAGPNQMCKLPQVLTRFQQYNIAFIGDISKMFLKIQQPEEFKKYSRVMWLEKTDRESRIIYEFNGHLFGNNGIYDLPPLHLRIKECALRTFLGLGELQEVAWIPKSKTKIGHLRWQRQLLPSTIDEDVITTVANITIPYCVIIDTTLPPAAADICLCTDGSLLEERSGAGVYIEVDQQPQVTMSKRLPPCTVFQSELRAIQMACEHLCLHEHNNKDIHVHVDSQAALQLLVKSQIRSKTVYQTVELFGELAVRHTVTLQWVKASQATRWRTRRQKQAVSLTGSRRWRFVTLERN